MSTIPLNNIQSPDEQPQKRPDWLKVQLPTGETFENVKDLMRSKTLHTVCEEAKCPNIGECWGRGTATFLMMGDICTRSCAFCDIKTGRPNPLDWQEPLRVAQAVKAMNLRHVVITSVNRDERKDGGAPIFAQVIQQIRRLQPGCSVEVLIPDFKGDIDALKIVMDARPDILNHNVETVPRLFKRIQPQDKYEWALATLEIAKILVPDGLTKTGIMVGLGETWDELLDTMLDLADCEVDILTIGQYLQPDKSRHLPVEKFYTPAEFAELHRIGLEMGYRWVESGPLVRSSYRADEQVAQLSVNPPHKAGSSIPLGTIR
ncbi:MAG: lipoyl synthase [Chloroflexi bacterium]|nr:MAG: lipoyl synthase [Chloroflexota bacterium]